MVTRVGWTHALGFGGVGWRKSAAITPVDPDLIAWWQGATEDKTGNGHDLTLSGGAAFSGTGPIGTPLAGNGSGKALLANAIARTGPEEFSVVLWYHGATINERLFGSTTTFSDYCLWNTVAGRLDFNVGAAVKTWLGLPTEGWNQIAFTNDSVGTTKLYVNSVLQAQVHPQTNAFDLGVLLSNFGDGGPYSGSMDGVQVYSVAIDQEKIDTLYALPNINQVDLFLTAGQSNGTGKGDSSESPTVPVGETWTGTGLENCADPVDNADTGSMWPAFAQEWFAKTRGKAIRIPSCVDGAALVAVAESGFGDYSPTGALRAAAVTEFSDAKTWIQTNTSYVINTENILWCQGENDAESIFQSDMTGADYEAALEAIAVYFDAQISQDMMYVIRTGRRNDGLKLAAFQAIRDAQDAACTDSALLTMTFTGTVDYPDEAKMGDVLHWNQLGLNEAGHESATLVATDKGF